MTARNPSTPKDGKPPPRGGLPLPGVFVVEDLCYYLHVGANTVSKWVECGLRPIGDGKPPYRFDGEDVRLFLRAMAEHRGEISKFDPDAFDRLMGSK